MATPANSPLPVGCILRQATLQDGSKLFRKNLLNFFLLVVPLLVVTLLVALGISFLFVGITAFKGLMSVLKMTIAGILLGLMIGIFTANIKQSIKGLWVVECHGELVAFAKLIHFRDKSYVHSLSVIPAWRRRGLGTALVKHLIQEATLPLYLTCNSSLVSFYSRLGFVPSRSNKRSLFGAINLVYNKKSTLSE